MSYTAWAIMMLVALIMNIITILMNLRDHEPNELILILAIVNAMVMAYFVMQAMTN